MTLKKYVVLALVVMVPAMLFAITINQMNPRNDGPGGGPQGTDVFHVEYDGQTTGGAYKTTLDQIKSYILADVDGEGLLPAGPEEAIQFHAVGGGLGGSSNLSWDNDSTQMRLGGAPAFTGNGSAPFNFSNSGGVMRFGDGGVSDYIEISGTGVMTSYGLASIPGEDLAPGGASTSLQFNDAGSFGGADELKWDNTLKKLILTGGGDGTITGGGDRVVLIDEAQITAQATAPDCAAEDLGTFYTDTSPALCWCNGSTWLLIAGAGSCA